MLDAAVQDILHPGPARVRQQAAIAERARPELGSPLKPADHTLFGEKSCRLAADVRRWRRRGLDANQKSRRGVFDIPIGVTSAEIGMIHDEATALLQDFQIAVISAADCNAVIAGRRLNPDILESGLQRYPAIGHAVQRDAAGHAQISGAGGFAQPAGTGY